MVRGREEPWGKPPAGGTPRVPSFKFSLCKLGPAAARAAVEEPRIALAKVPDSRLAARAAADCTSQTSVRKEGTQHGQGTVPGFKFQPRGVTVSAPATRAAGPD